MADSEIALNIIPQYSNFIVEFDNITIDGTPITMSSVTAWIFALGYKPTKTSTTPLLVKTSTGTSSGDFVINNVLRQVKVTVRASELSNVNGEFAVALFRDSSGSRISHEQKYFTIQPQLQPSGV